MIYDIPPFARFAELQENMESLGAKYLIVERDSLRDRIALLGPYFGHDPKGQLLIKSIPPGWRLATEDPFAPLDFAILERVSEASKSSGALRTADN